jgi:hypothetical protein
MASPCIRVIALRQFAVLGAHLGEADLSLQVEQAVFRLEMAWDGSLYPHPILSVKGRRAGQEGCGEHRPHLKVALDERFERIRQRFHT